MTRIHRILSTSVWGHVLPRRRRRAGCAPTSEQHRDDARRRPLRAGQAHEGLASTAPRVRPRPVIRRRQPSVELAPGAHRIEHPLASPATLDRAGVAGLAVRVSIALAVALCVRTAAAAHPLVAALDRPRLLAGGVVEVRLDRCRRATEPVGDLPDREALELAVMPCQGDRPSTLENPTHSRG
jgi:hypothetical protein